MTRTSTDGRLSRCFVRGHGEVLGKDSETEVGQHCGDKQGRGRHDGDVRSQAAFHRIDSYRGARAGPDALSEQHAEKAGCDDEQPIDRFKS